MGSHWSARYIACICFSIQYIILINYFSIINKFSFVSHDQVYYYQDVKCRDEMYDKDILMLQVGASFPHALNLYLVYRSNLEMSYNLCTLLHIFYRSLPPKWMRTTSSC